jgi:prepilin-type N-terminal cleavage/methylation domain-containing protein
MHTSGFSLTELLIALMILGEIATFTIPKVLMAQQSNSYNATAKEAIGTISGAYQSYKLAQGDVSCLPAWNLTSYLNYVAIDTTTTLDDAPGGGANRQCNNTRKCLRLHNGGMIYFWNQLLPGSTTQAFGVTFDPDGKFTGLQDSLEIEVFANGRVATWGTVTASDNYMQTNATCASTAWTPGSHDPTWLKW